MLARSFFYKGVTVIVFIIFISGPLSFTTDKRKKSKPLGMRVPQIAYQSVDSFLSGQFELPKPAKVTPSVEGKINGKFSIPVVDAKSFSAATPIGFNHTGSNSSSFIDLSIQGFDFSFNETLRDHFKRVLFRGSKLEPCAPNGDLGLLWRRDGFPTFAAWQDHIKRSSSNATKFDKNITLSLQGVIKGGAWRPDDCLAKQSVAIIISFRDREFHLFYLLKILHPLLQRQKLDYQIFVVEQGGEKHKLFNKGKLYNVGFRFVREVRPDIRCFIFHDVDLVPEDERMLYHCDDSGLRHLSTLVDTIGYSTMYYTMVGGVLAATRDQYVSLNGFSNLYWGWGGEDDDFGTRAQHANVLIRRFSKANKATFRYTMLSHKRRWAELELNRPERLRLIRTTKNRYRHEGLNTIMEAGFSLERVVLADAFVHVVVDVKKVPRIFSPLKPEDSPSTSWQTRKNPTLYSLISRVAAPTLSSNASKVAAPAAASAGATGSS